MIALISHPDEPVIKYFARYLHDNHYKFCFLNLMSLGKQWDYSYTMCNNSIDGYFSVGDERIKFGNIKSIYCRPGMIEQREYESAEIRKLKSKIDGIATILNLIDCRVLNRPIYTRSNTSKPFQLFNIGLLSENKTVLSPKTRISNQPVSIKNLLKQDDVFIYKSICSIRSEAKYLGDMENEKFGHIADCPVQVQNFIRGLNVRVHVLKDLVFPVGIESDGADYRYSTPKFSLYDLDKDVES